MDREVVAWCALCFAIAAIPIGIGIGECGKPPSGPSPIDCSKACESGGQVMLSTGPEGCKCAPKHESSPGR